MQLFKKIYILHFKLKLLADTTDNNIMSPKSKSENHIKETGINNMYCEGRLMVEIDCMETHFKVRSIEKLITPISGVSDVVVIPVPQSSGKTMFKLFVERDGKNQLSVETITGRLKDSDFKDITVSVTFCNIPRTPSGKVARQTLMDMYNR